MGTQQRPGKSTLGAKHVFEDEIPYSLGTSVVQRVHRKVSDRHDGAAGEKSKTPARKKRGEFEGHLEDRLRKKGEGILTTREA